MRSNFVILELDLFCSWKRVPPIYRLYVNHELFTERTYIWNETQYLKEIIQVKAVPGKYTIKVDNFGGPDCEFKMRNLKVTTGSARVIDSKTFEIIHES